MDIEIKRKGTNLKMYVNDNSDFTFSGDWWMIFGKFKADIFDNKKEKLYRIRKKSKLFQWKLFYEIFDKNNALSKLEPLNKRHSLYAIIWHQDLYQLKIHKGGKKSIFKNNKQVAAIDEPLISVANKETIKIIADYDVNLELIFLLVMCYNIDIGGDYELTFDFGNVSKMEKIDLNWNPK